MPRFGGCSGWYSHISPLTRFAPLKFSGTFRPSHISPFAHFAPHKLLAHFVSKVYIKKAALNNCITSWDETCEDEMCEIIRGEMCEGRNGPLDFRVAKCVWSETWDVRSGWGETWDIRSGWSKTKNPPVKNLRCTVM